MFNNLAHQNIEPNHINDNVLKKKITFQDLNVDENNL